MRTIRNFVHAPRLEALRARHQALEAKIEHEQQRPLPDFVLVTSLKRTRLAVKEEIVAIERMAAA
ncbi:MAG: YdcH family protein [Parvularculaceae bacterium]|nr:YdcH family protein [Parvularculaceae bacterium]